MTRPASGPQYILTRGNSRAQIGSVAAVLRDFSVGGVSFTETWEDPQPTPYGCGIVLAPWPNRIEGGSWMLDGKKQQLDITDPSNNCAIHGLLRNTEYQLRSVTSESVTLRAGIYPQHGYPFTIENLVTYSLVDDGLRVTHRLANLGSAAAPFGVGAHPYLRVGAHATADLTVTVLADTYLPINENKVPTAGQPVAGTQWDLRQGVSLAQTNLDTAYTDLTTVDGQQQVRLMAPDGTGLVLWADEIFGYVQVFTPRNFPIREHAVAVEPMTCAANAFNTADGLRWLQPGESFEASWGLRPVGF